MYKVDNSNYPTGVDYGVCLGANYPENRCWQGNNGTYYIDPTLDAELARYINSKPEIKFKAYPQTAVDNRGGLLYYRGMKAIEFFLDGTGNDCSVVGAEELSAGTASSMATRCRYYFPQ